MCTLSGEEKKKAYCLLEMHVGLRTESWCWDWGRSGHAGRRLTEMVNAMPGSAWEQKCQRCSEEVSYQALSENKGNAAPACGDLSSLVCPYGPVRHPLSCTSNFPSLGSVLQALLQPSPQMAAQEVLEIEHWLATRRWHGPSRAVCPGHYPR